MAKYDVVAIETGRCGIGCIDALPQGRKTSYRIATLCRHLRLAAATRGKCSWALLR